jgi:thiol:disulfide interchange protein DsbC
MNKHNVIKSLIVLLIAFSFLVIGCREGTTASPKNALSAEEAKEALLPLVPDVKIISVGESPVDGLWEIVIETRGDKVVVYMDSEKTKIISGHIIDLISKSNLTEKRLDEITRVDFSTIPLDNALAMGDPKAKYKAVVFDDPD